MTEGKTIDDKLTGREEIEIDETIRCSECDSVNLVRDDKRGELVCRECGLVIEEGFIDSRPERIFDFEQSKKTTHIGAPMTPLLHNRGLSTKIGWRNRDSHGKSIPYPNLPQLYRLRRWHQRLQVSEGSGKNLAVALNRLNREASIMGLPINIKETAATIYRKAADKKLIRGRNIGSVVAASLYAACRKCNVPRTLEEIASTSKLKKKEISRTYRAIARKLKLELYPTEPQSYIPRFCSELDLSITVQNESREILNLADKEGLISSRNPVGLAAASIYIASIQCNERRTQKEIADITGITEVTIRNRYTELKKKLDIRILL